MVYLVLSICLVHDANLHCTFYLLAFVFTAYKPLATGEKSKDNYLLIVSNHKKR